VAPHLSLEAAAGELRERAPVAPPPEQAPVRDLTTPSRVLALQRSAGNQATGAALGLGRRPLQRRLRYGPDFLVGQAKAPAGDNTFKKIVDALTEYRATQKVGEQLWLLETMLALIAKWVKANAKGKSADIQARLQKLTTLEADIRVVEMPTAQKEAQYLRDVKDQAKKTEAGKHEKGKLPHMSYLAVFAAEQATMLAEGKTSKSAGESQEALELMRKYDLTDAEVAAIKIYTVDDYKYINPALADNDQWMAAQLPKLSGPETAPTPEGIAGAKAEGKRHGETALAGIQKLPPWDEKPTYRGLRLTQKEFDAQYVNSRQFKTEAFQSTTLDPGVAERFAKRPKDDKGKDADDGKVGIVITLTVTNGRDIRKFSLLPEEEILLLPGATFTVQPPKKRPPAAEGGDVYDVVMLQTT
jgi:hypothetical protein